MNIANVHFGTYIQLPNSSALTKVFALTKGTSHTVSKTEHGVVITMKGHGPREYPWHTVEWLEYVAS